jgi:hypothetical protein
MTMGTQHVSVMRKDIISKLHATDDYALIETIWKLLSPSEDAPKTLHFPSMTKQQIIQQAILADKEIEEGKTTSHDDFYDEVKQW